MLNTLRDRFKEANLLNNLDVWGDRNLRVNFKATFQNLSLDNNYCSCSTGRKTADDIGFHWIKIPGTCKQHFSLTPLFREANIMNTQNYYWDIKQVYDFIMFSEEKTVLAKSKHSEVLI